MTWLPKLHVVLACTVAGLVLAACSSSDDGLSADPTSSGSPTGPSAPTSTAATPAAAECTVPGFVPRTTIKLKDVRPVVVYAHRVTLAPGSRFSSPDLDLVRADLLRFKVRPTDPSVRVSAAERRQILTSGGGPIENGTIRYEIRASVRVKNDTKSNRSYLVYRGSSVYSGDWTIKACGTPYNDGTTVERITGTYSTVTKIRPVAVAQCDVPASASDIDKHAAVFACRDF